MAGSSGAPVATLRPASAAWAAPPPVAVAAAAVCLFLCFLCGFSRSVTAGRCAAGNM
ncbi:hypothetical protein [Streptomyces canus]|uniref:hypothetical protein n=1 Tax=Streptomyces canus TaxID=58343 RepID=UPI0030DDF176